MSSVSSSSLRSSSVGDVSLESIGHRAAPRQSECQDKNQGMLVKAQIEDSDTFLNIRPNEKVVEAIKRLDPNLITSFSGKTGYFTRHTVLNGQLGLGTRHGRTLFYPPGNYRRIGIGCKLIQKIDLQQDGFDRPIRNGDITIVQLTANQVAVVQIGSSQYIIGSGGYILRDPTRLEGKIVDTKNLEIVDEATTITEIAGTELDEEGNPKTQDELVEKKVVAGYRDEAGSFTFLRAAPGYKHAIQLTSGNYRIGEEFTVTKGQERFVRWLDFQDYSRTTREFIFRSHDSQELRLRIQISWRLDDGAKWLKSGGTYEDPFDYLEERVQAQFRDEMGSKAHDEILKQQKSGFEDLELKLKPELQSFANQLGVKLLDMQVREMRFPELEKRRVRIAEVEAQTKQEIVERQRALEIQTLENKELAAKETAEQGRKLQAANKDAELADVEHKKHLKDVQAKVAQDNARLEAEKNQEVLKAEAAKIKALAVAEAEAKAIERKAEAKHKTAQLEAEAYLAKERAEIQAFKEKAVAEAEANRELGNLLRSNPELLQLKLAEKQAEILKSFANNSEALLPPEWQKEIVRMQRGFQPEYPPGYKQLVAAPKDQSE